MSRATQGGCDKNTSRASAGRSWIICRRWTAIWDAEAGWRVLVTRRPPPARGSWDRSRHRHPDRAVVAAGEPSHEGHDCQVLNTASKLDWGRPRKVIRQRDA